MALFGLITVEVTLIPLLVGLTNHLTLAMVPDDGHPGLQIPYMSDLIGEVGVRLTAHIKKSGIEIRRLAWMQTRQQQNTLEHHKSSIYTI
jgi:hypothetical protein